MATNFSLSGQMIPRTVRRTVDERDEPRTEAPDQSVAVAFRGRRYQAKMVNTSPSGAMLLFPLVPNIGERLTLDGGKDFHRSASVRWVRDGRIGVSYERS